MEFLLRGLSLGTVLVLIPFGAFAQTSEGTIDNFSVYSARAPQGDCNGTLEPARAVSGGSVVYGSWDRQRAVLSDLCFEVFLPGVTDVQAGPAGLEVFTYAPHKWQARFVQKKVDRFLYAVSLRDLDPVLHGISDTGNTLSPVLLSFRAVRLWGVQTAVESAPLEIRFIE